MLRCEAYIKGERCNNSAGYLSGYYIYIPGLDKKIERQRLCKSCAETRIAIQDYPWKIERIREVK